MESSLEKRKHQRIKRAFRVRKIVRGTSECPRLSIHRSNKHLVAQLIDDQQHKTLASIGTMNEELKSKNLGKKSKEAAREIGKKIAELAKEHKVSRIAFDRAWYRYHGLIAELANAAREVGLKF